MAWQFYDQYGSIKRATVSDLQSLGGYAAEEYPRQSQLEYELSMKADVYHGHDDRYGGYRAFKSWSGRYNAGIGVTGFTIANGTILYAGTTGATSDMAFMDSSLFGPSGCLMKARFWCFTETAPTANTLTAGVAYLTGLGAGATISANAYVSNDPAPRSYADVSITAAANTAFYGVTPEFPVAAGQLLYLHPWFIHSVNPAQAMTWGLTLYAKPF